MATIRIPPVLRPSVGGEKELAAQGSSVGEILRDLAARHPQTESQLFASDGELNRYVNVYLNDEDVRVLEGLQTNVSDGDTLVIYTTNLRDKAGLQGGLETLHPTETTHLVERFTAVDTDTLLYELTVSDPSMYTRPFTVQIPSVRITSPIYEYACHEGNYGMFGILRSARAE